MFKASDKEETGIYQFFEKNLVGAEIKLVSYRKVFL